MPDSPLGFLRSGGATPCQPDLFTPAPPAAAGSAAPAAPEEPPPDPPGPEQLHPALWRAHQLGSQPGPVWPSGFAALDAVLPGGGWPARGLSELLLPHPGVGEMRLLAPVLAAVQRSGRSVLLFDPPARPHGWALEGLGVDLRRLVVVHARHPLPGVAARALPAPADLLWALEQALASGEAGAVLAWAPPGLRAEALRRLQLAALSHDGPAFLLREVAARLRPSAAPLRLLLRPAAPDELAVQVVKRRGPPLEQTLALALAPVLGAPARARAGRGVAGAAALPAGRATRV